MDNIFSFSLLLTIIFVILKLATAITWPWIVILCPIWLPIAIIIFFYALYWIFILLLIFICWLLNKINKKS